MGLFSKKADPISERSRALKQEIAALETQIRALSERPEPPPEPVKRSSVPPAARNSSRPRTAREFPVEEFRLEADSSLAPELDISLEKPRFVIRMVEAIRGKPSTNPKLVTFLAAGSIQGLRPLRYEKRIARNRFILLSVIFLALLWGVLTVFLRNN
ncbi:MAG: hypothetical protein H0X66_21865 [Verrucomicrobia bacterium]|nr:hypothetical protein [Verrucomicrobiota bacterium]